MNYIHEQVTRYNNIQYERYNEQVKRYNNIQYELYK